MADAIPNWQRQAWLTEYQVCQQFIDSNAHRYRLIVSIFMPVATALLGGLIYSFIASDVSFTIPFQENIELPKVLALSLPMVILGIGVITMLLFLLRWLNRVNFYIRTSYHRMREIEAVLGMLKNRTIHWIDHPNETPNEQRERINTLRELYPPPPLKTGSLRGIFYTLISLWGVATLAALAAIIWAFIFGDP